MSVSRHASLDTHTLGNVYYTMSIGKSFNAFYLVHLIRVNNNDKGQKYIRDCIRDPN